ncbi:hypothetical protein [Rhodococcus sp. B10]|uniref:hypothetical protein n=1 Tax=Rhodococcus sp. B10 TaxID=2695876 RepID=UPI0014315ACA|nr:hypothetical protein [Rhodococcus sp. B10]
MERQRSATLTLAAVAAVLVILTAIPVLRLTGSDTVLRLPVLALIAAVTFGVLIKDGGTTLNPRAGVAGVAFLVVGCVANLRADDSYQWLSLGAMVGIAAAGSILGASTVQHDVVRPLFQWVIGLALVQCVYAVYEAFAEPDPLWRGARVLPDGESVALRSELLDGFDRAQGTMGHPLVLAALALTAVTLVIATDAVRSNPVKVALVAVLGAGILATGSRNAVILLVGLLVVLWGAASWNVMVGRAVVFGIPVAVIAVILGQQKIADLFDSGSYSHRAGAIEVVPRLTSIRDFATMIFGDGSASTPRLQNAGLLQSDRFIAIDNQFLLLFIQYGLAGTLLITGLLVAAIRRDRGAARVVLAVWLVQFFIFDVLAWPSSAFVVWLAVGIAVSTRKADHDPEDPSDARRSETAPGAVRELWKSPAR